MPVVAPFEVIVAATDGIVKIAVLGDLDCASAPRLNHVLDSLTDDPREVVVDLGSTEFVDCAGIGVLAAAHDRRRQLGGELVLESPSRAAGRVLDLTGLADRIPTCCD